MGFGHSREFNGIFESQLGQMPNGSVYGFGGDVGTADDVGGAELGNEEGSDVGLLTVTAELEDMIAMILSRRVTISLYKSTAWITNCICLKMK